MPKTTGLNLRAVAFAVTLILCAGAMILFSAIVSPRSASARKFLHQIRSESVQAAFLGPVPRGHDISLLESEIELSRGEIERLCGALRGTTEFTPSHPQAKWTALLRIVEKDGERSFRVVHSVNPENGTYLTPFSDAPAEWHFGDFRSDALGELIENLSGKR